MNGINKYILSYTNTRNNLNHAGTKAVSDVEDFLQEYNYESLFIIEDGETKNKVQKFWSTLDMYLKNKKRLKEKSILVYNYPISYGFIDRIASRLYIEQLKISNVTKVAIIHDINSLRSFKGDKISVENVSNEINQLNKFDYVISHNSTMSKWLRDNGLRKKIIDLEVFDYKIEKDIKKIIKEKCNDITIAFAGNLEPNKSNFVYNLDSLDTGKIKFNLYGPNYINIEKNFNDIEYKGVYKPEELTSVLYEDFGLIWDGNSLNSCSGEFGEYTKYNNPHKLSLYIAAGLPVIVWKKAAIAKFVEKYRIGICINSLEEIPGIIKNMTENEIENMKVNVNDIKQLVIKGNFIKCALSKVEDEIIGGNLDEI